MNLRKTANGAILVALLTAIFALPATAGAREAGDTTVPNTSVTAAPGSPTNETTAAFAFRSTEAEGARFQCSLDGGPFRSCGNRTSYKGLVEGRHSLKVRSIDAAGNADPTPASRSWTVDVTAPRTLLTVGEEGETTSTNARFDFVADEPVSGFYCSLDGAPSSRCAGPREFAGLPAGAHHFEVHARDRAGNTDPTPATASWTVVEERAPVVTIEGAPRIEGYHEYHYFTFSADVPDSSFYCSLDGEPFAPCASGGYRYVPYGLHVFRVHAVSPWGTRGETAAVEYESRDPNWD